MGNNPVSGVDLDGGFVDVGHKNYDAAKYTKNWEKYHESQYSKTTQQKREEAIVWYKESLQTLYSLYKNSYLDPVQLAQEINKLNEQFGAIQSSISNENWAPDQPQMNRSDSQFPSGDFLSNYFPDADMVQNNRNMDYMAHLDAERARSLNSGPTKEQLIALAELRATLNEDLSSGFSLTEVDLLENENMEENGYTEYQGVRIAIPNEKIAIDIRNLSALQKAELKKAYTDETLEDLTLHGAKLTAWHGQSINKPNYSETGDHEYNVGPVTPENIDYQQYEIRLGNGTLDKKYVYFEYLEPTGNDNPKFNLKAARFDIKYKPSWWPY